MASRATAGLASKFRALHKPGSPVILCNVWDAVTAGAVAKVVGTKALATASYAIAASRGIKDSELTFEQNLAAVRVIAGVVAQAEFPLTVDLQDGYEDVAASITAIIELGAVGCNIEDVNNRTGELLSKEKAVQRIKAAVEAARAADLPDFCVNARTDVLGFKGTIDDAIDRAKAFLGAGACTAFVWGAGVRDISADEVTRLVEELDGRISIITGPGRSKLSAQDLTRLGVARISMGPSLQFVAATAIENAVKDMYKQ